MVPAINFPRNSVAGLVVGHPETKHVLLIAQFQSKRQKPHGRASIFAHAFIIISRQVLECTIKHEPP